MASEDSAAREIRERFLRFFESRGHRRVASCVPGARRRPHAALHQRGHGALQADLPRRGARRLLARHHLAEVHARLGKHNDLENVGRTPRHHTFFEMLGNFSFGDYFKREAIELRLGAADRGWASPPESAGGLGLPRGRRGRATIWERGDRPARRAHLRLDEDENFWSMGDTGPCGPCSEIHSTSAPTTPAPARSATPPATAAAGSRSGTWSSCSSTATPRPDDAAAASPRSIPARGWSASRRHAPGRAPATTTPTSSQPSSPGPRSSPASPGRRSREGRLAARGRRPRAALVQPS